MLLNFWLVNPLRYLYIYIYIYIHRPKKLLVHSPEFQALLPEVAAATSASDHKNNPKLISLKNVLIEHFERYDAAGQASQTRAIVFTQYRDR